MSDGVVPRPSMASGTLITSEIEEIKRLKMRYMTCLNDKDWLGFVDILTEDASVSYENGETNYRGRNAIIGYLRNSLELLNAVHTASNGAVTLRNADSADGTWDLDYYWHDPWDNTSMRGRGVYTDRYVKRGGIWMIEFTGFVITQD